MDIEERLKNLRQSMTTTTFKHVNVDKQSVKENVLARSKKRRTSPLSPYPKRLVQGLGSMVGVTILCLLIVYAGMSGQIPFPNQSSEENTKLEITKEDHSLMNTWTERSVTDAQGHYNIFIVHDGNLETANANKWEDAKDEVYELEQLAQIDRVDYVVTGEYQKAFQIEQLPTALVFDHQEMVFETNEPEQLLTYISDSTDAP
ncbi:hypothetical protein ACFFGV_09390 [Pontibacillus salicampi]|uniref:Uncharacterized protein n=1 Tax=Pontibacillus salicampi TaxID=1449801 RepID=A0ABV6LN11_9BACI